MVKLYVLFLSFQICAQFFGLLVERPCQSIFPLLKGDCGALFHVALALLIVVFEQVHLTAFIFLQKRNMAQYKRAGHDPGEFLLYSDVIPPLPILRRFVSSCACTTGHLSFTTLCFFSSVVVTLACARRPGAAARVERRRRER